MKKGSFDLEGKVIFCGDLPALGDAGEEIFRALKVVCNSVIGLYDFEQIWEFPYLVKNHNEVIMGRNRNPFLKHRQPSDVLGQAAINAAMDGATIVFEGDVIPMTKCGFKSYYDSGNTAVWKEWLEEDLVIYKKRGTVNIVAYKLLDEGKASSKESESSHIGSLNEDLSDLFARRRLISLAKDLGLLTEDEILNIEEKQPSIESRILAEKTGSKHDQGKPLYNLIPVHAESELVDVLTFGATKYAPNQWRNVPNAKERYTAAAMRHLAAYRMGESHDTESGKHHLAHAMCCLAFIIELDLEDNQ